MRVERNSFGQIVKVVALDGFSTKNPAILEAAKSSELAAAYLYADSSTELPSGFFDNKSLGLLELRNVKLTAQEFALILASRSLEVLALEACTLPLEAELTVRCKPERVSLRETEVSEDWLKQLAESAAFERCWRLDLRGVSLSPEILGQILRQAKCEVLMANESSFDDRHLVEVAKESTLENLTVSRTKVTAQGLAVLATLPRLSLLSTDLKLTFDEADAFRNTRTVNLQFDRSGLTDEQSRLLDSTRGADLEW